MRLKEYMNEIKSIKGKWYLEDDDEKKIAGPFNTEDEANKEMRKRKENFLKSHKGRYKDCTIVQE